MFRQLLGLEADVTDGAHSLTSLCLESLAGWAAEVLRLLILGLHHQLGAAGHGGQREEGVEGEAWCLGDQVTVSYTGLGPGEQSLLLQQCPQMGLGGQAQMLGQWRQSGDHDGDTERDNGMSKLAVTAH